MRVLRPFFLTTTMLVSVNHSVAAETLHNLDIPGQNLAGALQQLSAQSGASLFYASATVKGLNAPGLKGKYSVESALKLLLSHSGLGYSLANDGSISVKPAPSQKNEPSSTLPTVKVTDTRLYDATDPYNTDYTLPNATAGTKTDTPIIETPLNVQVISKQVLKDQQAITLGDALKNVSGVVVTPITNFGNNRFDNGGISATSITLRGFQSQTYFRNGFRLQQGAGARELANVEAIEVLKGPAAVLYGLVEPGGIVNVVTKQPQATPYYSFNQQFGSFDNYRTTADATGPVAGHEDLLYRLNVSYQTTSGFQDFTGKDDVFVAPVFTWLISPKTQATVEFEYNRQHAGIGSSLNPYINGQLLDIPLSRNYGEYSPAVTETFFGGINWSHQFNEDWSLKHRFSVNQQNFNSPSYLQPSGVFGPDIFAAIVGLNSAPYSGLPVIRQSASNVFQNNTYSTNLDLVGHFDTLGLKHTLLLGGDYYRINNLGNVIRPPVDEFSTIDPFNPVHPGVPVQLTRNETILNSQQQIDQYGLYLQDQIKLPYEVHVTGGFRYQNLHQDIQNIDTTGEIALSRTVQSQDAVTPRFGLLWHPQQWVSLYANYSESFGVNTGLVFISEGNFASVAPTSATQYEGGIKTEFFDGRLRATLGYYDLTKTNTAVSDPDQTHNCGQGPGSCSLAIGEVRSQGPELDIQGEILPGWNAIATWANVDVRVTKSLDSNTLVSDANGNGFKVGDRLFNVPRNTASFWSTYEFLAGDLKGLKFGGGVNIQEGAIGASGVNFTNAIPPIKVPGYATLNLLAAYSRHIGKAKITLQLNVDNLLDKRYYTNINGILNDPDTQAFGAYAAFGAPRTFLGSINIQY
ncbi:MAG: TonB-dependent receptor [Methylococcaceae bacterium]|jgi:iron complex outermembrane receptor protein